jgi:hypothetical protein
MAFLKRRENYMDCPEWREAAARVWQMLAEKDAREFPKQDGVNLAWTITVPSPLAPQEQIAGIPQVDGNEILAGTIQM